MQDRPPRLAPSLPGAGGGAALEWRAGDVPVSTRFDDPYFALADGLAETAHVFLAGNDLPGRFAPGFRLAELGFGTGLNMLAAAIEWQRAGLVGSLRYTGFEAFALTSPQIARALAPFPALAPLAAPLIAAWEATEGQAVRRLDLPFLQAEVILGDARATVPLWKGLADAWFLDGFAPSRNPEMWEPPLLHAVARRTAPGGTLATYTAAGHVRRALAEAGLVVQRRPGFGTKRHMTVARLP